MPGDKKILKAEYLKELTAWNNRVDEGFAEGNSSVFPSERSVLIWWLSPATIRSNSCGGVTLEEYTWLTGSTLRAIHFHQFNKHCL